MSGDTRKNHIGMEKLFIGLAILCVVTALTDLLYEKHPQVRFEGLFNFNGFFAIALTVTFLLLAKCFRSLIARKEDYYDG